LSSCLFSEMSADFSAFPRPAKGDELQSGDGVIVRRVQSIEAVMDLIVKFLWGNKFSGEPKSDMFRLEVLSGGLVERIWQRRWGRPGRMRIIRAIQQETGNSNDNDYIGLDSQDNPP
jgi:hypothetical protein